MRNYRDKSTSQPYHQGSWSHYSQKPPPYTPTYRSSIPRSSPQVPREPLNNPSQTAVHIIPYSHFLQQLHQFCETPRTQTTTDTVRTNIHHITLGQARAS